MQVLVNKLICLYFGLSIDAKSYTISTRGVTFKGKALATKCIFQNYSQLLDICTLLVLKTAKELFVPSVVYTIQMVGEKV